MQSIRHAAAISILFLASCGSSASFTGNYTMLGQRTSAAACMGSPPSGAVGTADVRISAPDSNGSFTMEMRIGTSNACVLTMTRQGDTAAISNANNCDATVAPPFFTAGTGNLSQPGGQLRLEVHWSMTGPGTGTCTVDDVWTTPTR